MDHAVGLEDVGDGHRGNSALFILQHDLVPFFGRPQFSTFSNQTVGGNKIWSGIHVFNKAVSFPGGITGSLGPVDLSSLNSSFQFADSFSGADASCKIAAAIEALPPAGGVIVAKNLSDAGGTGNCTIDPGVRSVTIWLGPYTYKFSSVVWRSNLQIMGSGAAGNSNSTIISATNSRGALFTSGKSPSIATNIWLQGFRVYGPGITECASRNIPRRLQTHSCSTPARIVVESGIPRCTMWKSAISVGLDYTR